MQKNARHLHRFFNIWKPYCSTFAERESLFQRHFQLDHLQRAYVLCTPAAFSIPTLSDQSSYFASLFYTLPWGCSSPSISFIYSLFLLLCPFLLLVRQRPTELIFRFSIHFHIAYKRILIGFWLYHFSVHVKVRVLRHSTRDDEIRSYSKL